MAVAVHCWYIKDAFAGFCQQIFEEKTVFHRASKRKSTKTFCHTLQTLAIKGVGGVELDQSVKKKNLKRKSFSDVVHWMKF